tara:strand:+ start:734 stop:1450 length:717 start_codon:yes stop_codon:yes gene_type:complete
MKVEIIKCLKDNYSYIIIDSKNNACVVDPSEASPIIKFVEKNSINLKYILNTHHHFDHIGGNIDLKNMYKLQVIGFDGDKNRIPGIDIFLKNNDIWRVEGFEAKIIHIPGHTSGHICFYFYNDQIAFTGDTLFSLGCGRIFEGTYKDMFESLSKLKKLPHETKIYCGHEYTLNNSIFCLNHDKENKELEGKVIDIKNKIRLNIPTVPSTIKEELAYNIFLRAKTLQEFSKLRDLKDNF